MMGLGSTSGEELCRINASWPLIVNVELQKRDSAIKLLIGCTAEEQQTILRVHDQSSWGGAQSAIFD
jgi:hypothetical protein